MVLDDSRKIPLVPRYSGFSPEIQHTIQGFHLLRLGFPTNSCVSTFLLRLSYNPEVYDLGLGSFPFARHYLGNHFLIFFSYGYLDVSVPRVLGLSTAKTSS